MSLAEFGEKYFRIPKSTWNQEEMQEAYALYNELNGTTKKDTRCNSCRRSVILDLRGKWDNLKNTK